MTKIPCPVAEQRLYHRPLPPRKDPYANPDLLSATDLSVRRLRLSGTHNRDEPSENAVTPVSENRPDWPGSPFRSGN
jgi:hypothetical protein